MGLLTAFQIKRLDTFSSRQRSRAFIQDFGVSVGEIFLPAKVKVKKQACYKLTYSCDEQPPVGGARPFNQRAQREIVPVEMEQENAEKSSALQ